MSIEVKALRDLIASAKADVSELPALRIAAARVLPELLDEYERLMTERDGFVSALEPFARYAERYDSADERCGHLPDECNLDGSLGSDLPSIGDCRRAREALAKVGGT